MIIKVIGLIIIAASFVFILKRPDKSLMDTLTEQKNKKLDQENDEDK